MSEYEQLCRILDKGFEASNQNLMVEDKGKVYKPQIVRIDNQGRKHLAYTLYRFDLEDKDFLPFFNKSNASP